MSQIVKVEPKPFCPQCGAMMELRRNRNDGSRFWGCQRFQDGCRGTRGIEGVCDEPFRIGRGWDYLLFRFLDCGMVLFRV